MTQAKLIAEKATAILFLNQQWLAHLSEVLDRNGLLDETLDGFINHAKTENRQAFNEINKLGKDAEDAVPRRTVAEALADTERLLLAYEEWEDDLDETGCSTGGKHCRLCDGGGHVDKRRRSPIRHRPDCPREIWNQRATIAALNLEDSI